MVYRAGRPTVEVRRGDALWRIAGRCLRNPLRWRQIYRLSAARYDRHGQMRGGEHIEPGWILTLPTDATGTPAGHSRVRPHPNVPHPTPPTTTNPTPADDDGISPATPSPSTSPAIQPSRPATTTAHPARRCPTPGVQLPSDSWIELGLATAITAAAAAVWRHRRRQYLPKPPRGAQRDDPDLAALPPVVTQAEAGLRHTTTTGDDGDLLPALPDHPGPEVEVEVVGLDVVLHSPTGLGLTGPGAGAAARSLLVAALADDAPGAQVVIPAATATALLGTAALPATPRLHLAGDLDDAVRRLEEQVLHRTRLLDDHQDTDSLPMPGDLGPDGEPLVPLLLLAEVPPAAGGLTALLHQGHRLHIHAVLVGAWPPGTTLAVAGDGTTAPADGRRPIDVPARLSVLDAGETLDLLGTLAEAHTGHPPTNHNTPPTPQAPPASALTTGPPGQPHPTDRPAAIPDTRPRPAGSTADPPEPTAPVTVTVLGSPAIVGAGPGLRAKSLELLVYLAAHDGQARRDAIIEDLLPDAPTSRAAARLHTYVWDLRHALRHAGAPEDCLTRTGNTYRLRHQTLRVDLWRMRQAIHTAAHTKVPAERIAALRLATTAYTGPLAGNHDYEWITAARQATARQALQAARGLAQALAGQPAEQAAVLDTAIGYHPYNEDLYRDLIRAHAALRDSDSVRATVQRLNQALAEIDTQPDPDTTALADHLLRNPPRPDPPGHDPATTTRNGDDQ